MRIAEYLRKQPEFLLLTEAALLVIGIGYLDFKTGYGVSLYVFYSIPILLVVWFMGRNAGLCISVFSAVVWSVADLIGRSYDFRPERFWNMTVQLTFFVFIVIGGAALKGQRDESRARVVLLERFHTLAQILPVGVFRISLDGAILYANERWRKIVGIDMTASLPAQWTSAFHPDDRERLVDEWARTVREQRLCGFEARFKHPGGRTVWALGQVAPEPDGSGGIAGYVGAVTDMTELRRLEREVLEISEREQQRIGQDLHDDLCQQLVAIQFSAATAKNAAAAFDSKAEASCGEIVEMLKSAVVNARQMARRIFPVHLDQAGLMSALGELAESSSRFFCITCRFECPDRISVEDHTIGTHLYRIAQEALSNAIRHGHATEVIISLATANHRLTLAIADNGVGLAIAPDESTGMGLHIMHYRARMIGATFHAERNPAGGTMIRCVLPQHGRQLRQLVASATPDSSSHAL
jgi:PAS domain S-box-containing protein